MRRRLRTKKPFISYILPLFLSVGVIVLVILLINVLFSFFSGHEQQNRLGQTLAEFQVTSPNVYLVLNNKPSKINEGWNNLTLGHQEGVMTGAQGKVELRVDRDQLLRLDEFTSVLASWANSKKYFGVEKGNVWYEGDGNITPQTLLKTPLVEVDPQDKASVLVVVKQDMQQVAVFSGTASVIVTDKSGREIEKKTLESGNQLDVEEKEDGTVEARVVPSTLYDLEWVQWNRGQVSGSGARMPENGNTNRSDDQVNENTNEQEDVQSNKNNNDNTEKELPKPTLSTVLPKNAKELPAALEGRVSKDIVKVQVNEFVLQKFVPNSGTWKYQLIDGYNIKSGVNTFRVVGYDENGAKTPILNITVPYEKEVTASTNANVNTNTNASSTTKNTNKNESTTLRTNSNTNTSTTPSSNANQNTSVTPTTPATGTGSVQ